MDRNCVHDKIADHKCQKCGTATFIACTHPIGPDNAGFCKLSNCGQDIRTFSHNTLKKNIEYVSDI